MSEIFNVVLNGTPIEFTFYDENTLEAQKKAIQAAESAETAVAAKDVALLAAIGLGPFANTTAGLAATTNGQYFYTVSPANLYRNNAGTAVLTDELATLARSLGPFASLLIDDDLPLKDALESIAANLAGPGGAAFFGFSAGGASPATLTGEAKVRQLRSAGDKTGNLTAQIGAWITDLTAASGGRIAIPAGGHTMTAGVTLTNGYDLQGDGRIRTVIDPNFAGTVFSISGGVGVTPYHNRISGLGFFSASNSNRTLFHVRNGANTEIGRVSMPAGGIAGSGSIGILHEGREFNWYHDNILSLAKPLRIQPNPEAVSLNITTDYLVCEREHYIVTSPTEACVSSVGAYLSNTAWRDCALVKGAEGIKLVNTTLPIASHNVSIMGCRKEQADTASAYGFHFEFGGGGGVLQNLTFINNYTAAGQNGIYGRGVEHGFVISTVFTQGTGRTALDWAIPPGGSLHLAGCSGQVGGAKTMANAHPILRVPSTVANNPIGTLEHWVYFVTPADGGPDGLINYDGVPSLIEGGVETACFEMTVPTGSRSIRLPLLPANTGGTDPVGAMVTIRAKTGYFRAFYPADGSVPTTIEATGPFASTATSNRIYAENYPNGIISNTLAATQVLRIEVRK